MKRQYLHLSAYSCDKCRGPVVSGSVAVRENEISKETNIRQLGAVCLSCGHRQSKATAPAVTREFPPAQWESATGFEAGHMETAYFEALNRAELH
jgi:hypothetical protein